MKSALAVAAALCAASAFADGFDAATASLDDCLLRVNRYGDSEQRRAEKAAARDRIFADKAAGLDFLMSKIHIENITIHVLTQNLVEQMNADEALPVLFRHLDSPQSNTVRATIYFLSFFPAPQDAAKLTPLLANDQLRGTTIRTLGKWRARELTETISRYLADPNERVRVAAANALRDIGDPRAIEPLITSLADPIFTVRNTALRALVRFGAEAEHPVLAAAEKANGAQLRQLIAAMGQLGSPACKRALAKFERSEDPLIRADAQRALELAVALPQS